MSPLKTAHSGKIESNKAIAIVTKGDKALSGVNRGLCSVRFSLSVCSAACVYGFLYEN